MKLIDLIRNVSKGAALALPFLVTFMDKVATIALVDGTSMQPNLNPNGLNLDWVLIKRWRIDQILLSKGEVISFESPREPGTFMIKRVQALENEKIYDTNQDKDIRIPRGHLWVEGDNKRASYDSRHFGSVPRGLINGKAIQVVWPPSRFGIKLNSQNLDITNNEEDF